MATPLNHQSVSVTRARTSSTGTMRSEVELQVSSKHLSLASPVFDQCLKGLSIGDPGIRTIPLPHNDYHAMEKLPNIIHGRTNRVLRRLKYRVAYTGRGPDRQV
jgi:hypothetical protein